MKPPSAPDISERTIRRWTLSGKLPATKHGSQCKIALADLEPLLDSRPPDVKELLTRLQALEDLEDVQASQASRLTDLERQVYCLPPSSPLGLLHIVALCFNAHSPVEPMDLVSNRHDVL